MRAWLFDQLTGNAELQSKFGGVEGIKKRVLPRQSQTSIPQDVPFLMYGLGNATSLQLDDSTSNDTDIDRQFFQVWINDPSRSFMDIDEVYIPMVKAALVGKSSKTHNIITVGYLETSQEFSNETYNTIFRYLRFEAIKGRVLVP